LRDDRAAFVEKQSALYKEAKAMNMGMLRDQGALKNIGHSSQTH